MMRTIQCPELEALFDAAAAGGGPALQHAVHCAVCSALLEQHRQLEKDLYRVVDPLPPPDFVRVVMSRVEATPAPLRREVTTGLGILGGALVLAVAMLAREPQALGRVGLVFGRALVDGRELFPRLLSALATLWDVAGFAGITACSTLLFAALFGLKRLSGGPTTSEA